MHKDVFGGRSPKIEIELHISDVQWNESLEHF